MYKKDIIKKFERIFDFGGGGKLLSTPKNHRRVQYEFRNRKESCFYYIVSLKGIPLAAYDYIVNSKSAIEWVMERQAVTTHKDSGITNDANDWATETMGNARYPLELLLRVITVSIETMKIVLALPTLTIEGEVEIESQNAA